jgi:hypothetical protein
MAWKAHQLDYKYSNPNTMFPMHSIRAMCVTGKYVMRIGGKFTKFTMKRDISFYSPSHKSLPGS